MSLNIPRGGNMTKSELLAMSIIEMISMRDSIEHNDLLDMILSLCNEVRDD